MVWQLGILKLPLPASSPSSLQNLSCNLHPLPVLCCTEKREAPSRCAWCVSQCVNVTCCRGTENFARANFVGKILPSRKVAKTWGIGPSRALEVRAVTPSDSASDSDRGGVIVTGPLAVLPMRSVCLLHVFGVSVQAFGRMAFQPWGSQGGQNCPLAKSSVAKLSLGEIFPRPRGLCFVMTGTNGPPEKFAVLRHAAAFCGMLLHASSRWWG